MADFPISPDELRRLAKLVEQHDLSELRYEEGELRITLRTTVPVAVAPSSASPLVDAAYVAQHHGPDVAAFTEPAAEASGVQIEAPIMGVFYRSPSPGAPAFVEIGDRVEVGQPIGMIEAMKVFSEVLSEHAGVVKAIPTENGKLVQPGDPLVTLEA